MFELEFPSVSIFTYMHDHIYLTQLFEELDETI